MPGRSGGWCTATRACIGLIGPASVMVFGVARHELRMCGTWVGNVRSRSWQRCLPSAPSLPRKPARLYATTCCDSVGAAAAAGIGIGVGLLIGRRTLRAKALLCRRMQSRHMYIAMRSCTVDSRAPREIGPPVVLAEDVLKPANDEKQYRVLELENGLQVFLASDSMVDTAAAAIAVQCGTFQDTDNRPGLAHFHEHMLFLGTEKYPQEDEYSRYLNEHGGDSNAFTMGEFTTYYFKVAAPYLSGALDRFSQFFVAPLFDPSCVEREMNAVDSESTNYSTEDAWRALQIQKSTASTDHPFHRFDVGNLKTLGADSPLHTREELIRWNKDHYQAGAMKLVIVGRESLDELQAIVAQQFGSVRSGRGVEQNYRSQAWPKGKLGRIVHTVPLKESRSVSCSWPLPPRSKHPFLKPELYLAHVLGHEGPGSLRDALNQRGWVDQLVAGPSHSFSDSQLFTVSITLTPEGDENRDSVLDLLFAYVNLVRESGPMDSTFHELSAIQEIAFSHKEESPAPDDFVAGIAHSLFYFSPREAIRGPFALDEWSPDIVREYLDVLRPENSIIFISSPDLANSAGLRGSDAELAEGWQREAWYRAPFRDEPIPAAQLLHWQTVAADADCGLSLPEPNPFIPQNFDLCGSSTPVASRIPVEVEAPALILSEPLLRLWHKTDNAFCSPREYVLAHVHTPAYDLGPETVMMMRLFCSVVNDDLNSYAYDASIAGLSFGLEYSDQLTLSVGGFSDKLPGLLQVLVDRFRDVLSYAESAESVQNEDDHDRMEELRERLEARRDILLMDYMNLTREEPWSVSSYYTTQVMMQNCWHLDEYIEVLQRPLSLPALAASVRAALKGVQMEILVHGNASADDARDAASTLRDFLLSIGAGPIATGPQRAVTKIPVGQETIFEYDLAAMNPAQENCSTQNIYQVGIAEEDLHRTACLELVCHLASTSAYDKLRTQEQLGYIVSAGVWSEQYVCGIAVLVQGPRLAPVDVDERIEAWLDSFGKELNEMTEDDFATNIRAVVSERTQRYATMTQETMRHWAEIVPRKYCFDRIARSVESLEALTKKEVLKFFGDYLDRTAQNRRKLSLRILGTSANGALSNDGPNVTVLRSLPDIRAFKSSSDAFPLPRPSE